MAMTDTVPMPARLIQWNDDVSGMGLGPKTLNPKPFIIVEVKTTKKTWDPYIIIKACRQQVCVDSLPPPPQKNDNLPQQEYLILGRWGAVV